MVQGDFVAMQGINVCACLVQVYNWGSVPSGFLSQSVTAAPQAPFRPRCVRAQCDAHHPQWGILTLVLFLHRDPEDFWAPRDPQDPQGHR